MVIRNLGPLAALLLAASAQFSLAQAQGSDSQQIGGGDHQRSAVGAEYAAQCQQNGLRCTLVYGDASPKVEPASNTTTSSPQRKPLMIPREPVVSGSLAVAVVLVGLILVIGLWIRFGNGGVLLSSAPRDIKRQGRRRKAGAYRQPRPRKSRATSCTALPPWRIDGRRLSCCSDIACFTRLT